MADIIFKESYDHYSNIENTSTGVMNRYSGSPADTSARWRLAGGRFGGLALERFGTTSSSSGWRRSMTAAVAEYTIGMAVQITNLSFGCLWAMCDSTGLAHGCVAINPDGSFQFARSGSGTTLTVVGSPSAPGTVPINEWFYIEAEMSHSVSAEGRIYINGNPVPVLSQTGIDLRAGGDPTVSSMRLGTYHTFGTLYTMHDDVYITNAMTGGRLGPQRFESFYPTTDVSNSGFALSAGASASALLDESVWSNTDFVTGSAVADLLVTNMSDMTATPQQINDVTLYARGYATDAGARAINLGLSSGGVVSDGPDIYLPSSVGLLQRDIGPLNPTTGLAWTRAEIDALLLRLKIAV